MGHKFKAVWIIMNKKNAKEITNKLMDRLPSKTKLYEQGAMDFDYKGKNYEYYVKAYGIVGETKFNLENILQGMENVKGFAYYDTNIETLDSKPETEITNQMLCIGDYRKALPNITEKSNAVEICDYLLENINEHMNRLIADYLS